MKRPAPRIWLLATTLLVAGVGAAFWWPAYRRAGGHFPVPLDDVYIHFGFARSAALGHPFAWIPGNGYSSGGTSLTYPLLLAPAWLVGLRGERLGGAAALLAILCVVDLAGSIRRLLTGAPRWASWLAPTLVLAVPLLDWSLFSGMETALFAALLGRALVSLDEATVAPPSARARAQRRVGVLAALLIATRPEAAPLSLMLGIAAAHASRALSLPRSLSRVIGPPLLFLALQAGVNRALTGEWSAAGAVRKLLASNPYTTSLDVAGEVIKNLVALREQALGSALGGPRGSGLLLLFGLVAALDSRTRRHAVPLLLGAWAALLLVSLNATARFQNLRYAAPTLLMLLVAAALGVGALARRRALGQPLAALGLGLLATAPIAWFPLQIEHFARSSANIAGQQVEVARRIAELRPLSRSVLVGDAGAIPYLSGKGAIDGLGLGGYKGLPFARASVHGVPAVVELIERLPASERPDLLALYPSWWVGLAEVFGKRAFGVRIEDNVICAADEKVVYDADWSALAPAGDSRPGAVDALDVADLVDERAHHTRLPAPRGGWVTFAVLREEDGRERFDAGRIVPEGRGLSFTVGDDVARGDTVMSIRTDGGGLAVMRVVVERGGLEIMAKEVAFGERPAERWSEIAAPLGEVGGGDRVTLVALHGALRVFHLWLDRGALLRNPSPARPAPRP